MTSFRDAVNRPITSARHRAILERIVTPPRHSSRRSACTDADSGNDGSGNDSSGNDGDGRGGGGRRSGKTTTLAGRVWQADHITEVRQDKSNIRVRRHREDGGLKDRHAAVLASHAG